jgi:acetyltransferase-like isoleucine patch superfamily enzyme
MVSWCFGTGWHYSCSVYVSAMISLSRLGLCEGERSLGRRSLLSAMRGISSNIRACIETGFADCWARFWMRYAGLSRFGRIATRLATWSTPPLPLRGRINLANLNPRGYISASATVQCADFRIGANVFVGDRVSIFQDLNGGPVELGDRAQLHKDITIRTGPGGSLTVGADTHIQSRCLFIAYEAPIWIGRMVEIGPNCAFYPYDHGFAAGEPIMMQPLQTKGEIFIHDEAWLGYGVIVLSGVRIGKGAVVGAGSVVTRDVPDDAIAAGSPARVVRMRSQLAKKSL